MTTTENNKRIAKNTLMLYFRMILTMLVSLYTSRVVLNVLGVEDYGTYAVVGGVVSMFGFFNGAMASATQRFLSFDLGRNDFIQLRKTFNATQIIHIGIAILVFILAETIGIWFIANYLKIPDGRMEAALWIYHFSVLAFMVSIIQVPYNAVIIARERMSVYAYVSILEVLLKLLIVFMLTWIAFDKLKLYGILLFGVTFVIAAIYRIYARKQFDETKFEVVKDKELYKTLVSYSGWNLFGNIAAVARTQGLNIVLNIFFGTIVNAAYGITSIVQGAIQAFVTNFQTAVNPQIIKNYAKGELNAMKTLIFQASRFSYYLLFILSFPVIMNVDYILKLWLNDVPQHTATFIKLGFIYLFIDTISYSLIIAVQATGNIKWYQIIIGTFIFLNLPLSYAVLRLGGNPESVFYVLIIVTFLTLVLRMGFVNKLLKIKPIEFIKNVIYPIVLTTLIAIGISFLTVHIFDTGKATNFIELVYLCLLFFAIAGLTIYFIGFKKSERSVLQSYINSKINNLK